VFVVVFSFRTLSQCVVSLTDVWRKIKGRSTEQGDIHFCML
jgi:hypothetical protein